MTSRTVTVVLGGGRGTRLFPLTAVRSKPAVPIAGKYRLIDVPISNSINSGLREIFVLTQFNSASLNQHVSSTYQFDQFSRGAVEVLAAEQTDESASWFQGTADAVRQHRHRFLLDGVDNVLVLSGDHLYRMDYSELIQRHEAVDADVTVSAIPVSRDQCSGFGVLVPDADGFIRAFREKPKTDAELEGLDVPEPLHARWDMGDRRYIASMGVYVFRASVLARYLNNPDLLDFGMHILPHAVREGRRVAAYRFDGYWEDIGTVKSFYEANLALTRDEPPFRFYEPQAPIYTRARFLPPSVMRNLHVDHGFIADGCLLFGAEIVRSVIGNRSRLHPGCRVVDSIIMGADYFERETVRDRLIAEGKLPIGIGENVSIRRAIIDKNARVGAGSIIHGDPSRPDVDREDYSVRDGIIVVRKGAVIPPGTVL
ncbi:MAG TPA: glucose-1-phosphate adenylyltransferase [Myxococcota bacterium]|nr:glucose-1-phosphate adenylyltransferase [Myxococcota bacterium]